MDEGLYFCTVALYLLSDLPLPPLPKLNVQYIQTVCGCGEGGGGGVVELCCRPHSAGFLHSVSDKIQNLQNCFTTPNKNDQRPYLKNFDATGSPCHELTSSDNSSSMSI